MDTRLSIQRRAGVGHAEATMVAPPTRDGAIGNAIGNRAPAPGFGHDFARMRVHDLAPANAGIQRQEEPDEEPVQTSSGGFGDVFSAGSDWSLPSFADIAGGVGGAVETIGGGIGSGISAIGGGIGDAVSTAGGVLGSAQSTIGSFIGSGIAGTSGLMGDAARGIGGLFGEGSAGQQIGNLAGDAIGGIGGVFGNALSKRASQVGGGISGLAGALGQGIGGISGMAGDAVSGGAAGVGGAVRDMPNVEFDPSWLMM
jgi:hypothetical protein